MGRPRYCQIAFARPRCCYHPGLDRTCDSQYARFPRLLRYLALRPPRRSLTDRLTPGLGCQLLPLDSTGPLWRCRRWFLFQFGRLRLQQCQQPCLLLWYVHIVCRYEFDLNESVEFECNRWYEYITGSGGFRSDDAQGACSLLCLDAGAALAFLQYCAQLVHVTVPVGLLERSRYTAGVQSALTTAYHSRRRTRVAGSGWTMDRDAATLAKRQSAQQLAGDQHADSEHLATVGRDHRRQQAQQERIERQAESFVQDRRGGRKRSQVDCCDRSAHVGVGNDLSSDDCTHRIGKLGGVRTVDGSGNDEWTWYGHHVCSRTNQQQWHRHTKPVCKERVAAVF